MRSSRICIRLCVLWGISGNEFRRLETGHTGSVLLTCTVRFYTKTRPNIKRIIKEHIHNFIRKSSYAYVFWITYFYCRTLDDYIYFTSGEQDKKLLDMNIIMWLYQCGCWSRISAWIAPGDDSHWPFLHEEIWK